MFLERIVEQYMKYLKAREYSPRTIKDYRHNLKMFKRYLVETNINTLNEINREVIFKYQLYLSSYQPAISVGVRSNFISTLKGFVRYLLKSNQIMADYATDMELPRRRKTLPKGIMSKKEIQRLMKQPDTKTHLGIRDRALLELMYGTGIRNQEVRQLKINNIDFHEETLQINNGKGARDRVVPLSKMACQYLKRYLQESRPKFINNNKDQTLFIGKKKCSLSSEGVRLIIRKYVKKAGIKKKITPHSLRHSCATHMLKNRSSLRHIQELLGHKSLETTQKYTQVEISDLKRAYQKYHPRARDNEED